MPLMLPPTTMTALMPFVVLPADTATLSAEVEEPSLSYHWVT